MKTKLTKLQAIALAKRFIADVLPSLDWYSSVRPYVKAIVLYGSTAKGMNRKNSDIDLLIFMPLEIEEKHTTGEYFYKHKDRDINVVIRSIERLRRIAQEHNDTYQREVFREAEIIQASDDEVSKLLAVIATI